MEFFANLIFLGFAVFIGLMIFYFINNHSNKLFTKRRTSLAMSLAATQEYSEAKNTLWDAKIRYVCNDRLESSANNFKLPYGFWHQPPSIIASALLTLSTRHMDLAIQYCQSLADLLFEQSCKNPRLMLSVTCEMACRDQKLFNRLLPLIPKK